MTERKAFKQTSADSGSDMFSDYEGEYEPVIDPTKASSRHKFGRTRTFSVFETKSLARLNQVMDPLQPVGSDLSLNDGSSPLLDGGNGQSLNKAFSHINLDTSTNFRSHDASSESLSPGESDEKGSSVEHPAVTKRPSIVPIYNDISLDSIDKFNTGRKPNFHIRRSSLDDSYDKPKRFYINDIDLTLRELLNNEDTDNNYQITIDDEGPKVLRLGTANSNGFKNYPVRGTYMLSNLLQELTIAKRFGMNQIILDESILNENPVVRMKRLITTKFWESLTREVTKSNIVEMSRDTKIVEEVVDENGVVQHNAISHRIYVPHNRKDQYDYFSSIKDSNPEIHLDVQYLPEKIDARFVRSINKKPGLLSLACYPDPDDPLNLINEPYVVPGGRFNELYGWDSYMMAIGLLVDASEKNNFLRLAKGMTENFIYEIHHYGKILNANRSYYLARSQPPFLTDMALRVYYKMLEIHPEKREEAIDFLKRAFRAAVKEYINVWTSEPRLDKESGLSCYHPEGLGIPPETEASHFQSVLEPYAKKHRMTQEEFISAYNEERIKEPNLDEYLLHDRAVRESGHDTSYRLEGKCAYLATVDLNSLLYKYEVDIAFVIETFFNDEFYNEQTGETETSNLWREKAKVRKEKITKYLWNENDSIFYDYNIKTKEQTGYESATAFWPLWANVATKEQAEALVKNSLPKFEEYGGLVAGTLKSRGDINLHRPSRQWDYPYGWAPQQILAWIGLNNYGYSGIARRLIYRWLFLMTRAFVDYNGVVVEKYNVIGGQVPHKVDAEYGNQGLDFKGVATEGFGWVNASYVFGLTFLNLHAKRNLGTLTPPDVFLRNLHPQQREQYV